MFAMIGVFISSGQLALIFIIISGLITRILSLQAFQIRELDDRRLEKNRNRYTGEIGPPPFIARPPPGYSVYDLIQIAENERVAFSPYPTNFKPKVPLLPPPKRSPADYLKENRAQSIFTKRSCEEISRWEKLSQGMNFHSEEVDVYEGQWFWVTRCVRQVDPAPDGYTECFGVARSNEIADGSCVETMAWVLAYSRLKSDPFGEYEWDYIAVPNCCSCKIQLAPGEHEVR
ncbi:uncharacterized protein LOC121405680 [Lytechinus variegatus]|uniref:uncharacterized protein LOC121405680 n=1 Tax=Lytechinus variegatus TaxID=7654 RepID=UPI001BB1E8C2|nr:uncharacterized protein LOC121405680 [Lytechinus variegatus]